MPGELNPEDDGDLSAIALAKADGRLPFSFRVLGSRVLESYSIFLES